jgi:hypothetical protein
MAAKTIINSLAAIGGVALAVPTGGLSLGVTAGAVANQAWAGERSTEFNNVIDKAIEAAIDNPNLFDSEEYLSKTLEIDD